jgi:arylsulfatase A-like enzyme/HEAT repeat protein
VLKPSEEAVPPRAAEFTGLCTLGGAFGALFAALGDFGAMWLWLPVWGDRAMLLAKLLTTLLPLGYLGGLAVGLLGAALATVWRALGPARTRAWPLVLGLFTVYPARLLALKLCSGGMMSRLPQRAAIEHGFTLGILAAVLGAVALGVWLVRSAARSATRARALAAALAALAFALGKLNQTVYPNLYDYLHAALAFGTWATAGLAFVLLRDEPRMERLIRPLRRPGWVALGTAIALAVGYVNARRLDDQLNVRVAMFDPRSPVSRSVLAGAEPLLVRLAPPPERSHEHALASARADTSGLPTLPGAHVLLVTIDALRADHLGAYGYARPTSPELDALAQKSVRFTRAYAQAPHSSYSLSSLHTSEYVHEVVELPRPLPRATLASTFKEHGYHTAAFFTDGIFHTEGHRLTQYRDSALDFALFDHTNREAEAQTDRVLAEADRIVQRGEGPSFLWVHYFDVHEPYEDTHFGASDLDRYDSEILHTDRELARLLRELDARFSREIVVAITADHGEEFREHGGVYHGSTLFEEQVRVPLILSAKTLTPAVVDAPVELVDVAPTLLGAVGLPPAPSMRGKDLRAYDGGTPKEALSAFSAVLTKRMAVRLPYKLVADLRFGLFELYDLERDPGERKNLAGSMPDALSDMRGLVYAWLDALETAPGSAPAEEPLYTRALRWGRLGDRRAVVPMTQLLRDETAPVAERLEAGHILAKLADEDSADALVEALHTKPPEVAAEAAIALGRMYDARARDALVPLVEAEDPYVRARAAVSLGRLRDVRAVDALIDALWVAPTQYEREEAVRWLGRLRDPRATEPLLSLLPEFGLRYLVSVALGQVGDPRSYEALSEMLSWEHHTNVRDELVRGLGMMGDARAIPALVRVLREEPDLRNTAESLVRLGALEKAALGGLDVSPDTRGLSGFGRCQAGPMWHDWDYAQRTTCETLRARATAQLPLGPSKHTASATVLVRLRRVDAPEPCDVELAAGGVVTRVRVDATFSDARIALPAAALIGERLELALTSSPAEARLALDHALIVPP